MGGSQSSSVKKDYSGFLKIKRKQYQCFLYQTGGSLIIAGKGAGSLKIKKIIRAIISAGLDFNPWEWVEEGRENERVFFAKK